MYTHHFLYHDDLGSNAFHGKEQVQQAKVEQHQHHAVEGTCHPEVCVMQREAKDNGEDEGHVHQHVDQVPQVADSATDLVRDEPWVDSLEQLKNTQTQTKDIKTHIPISLGFPFHVSLFVAGSLRMLACVVWPLEAIQRTACETASI